MFERARQGRRISYVLICRVVPIFYPQPSLNRCLIPIILTTWWCRRNHFFRQTSITVFALFSIGIFITDAESWLALKHAAVVQGHVSHKIGPAGLPVLALENVKYTKRKIIEAWADHQHCAEICN